MRSGITADNYNARFEALFSLDKSKPPDSLPCKNLLKPTLVSVSTHESLSNLSCAALVTGS